MRASLECRFESDRNPHSADSNEVVATSMPYGREGVHFGVDPNDSAPCSLGILCSPGRAEPQIMLRNSEALCGHEACQQIMGVSENKGSAYSQPSNGHECRPFLEREFRVIFFKKKIILSL